MRRFPLLALLALLTLSALAIYPDAALGQDRIRLEEVLPALRGTERGRVDLGDAPPAGSTRVVRRADVLRALRRAGQSAQGLSIPRARRITRRARAIRRDRLLALATPAVAAALSPCEVREVRVPRRVTVAAGRLEVRAEGSAPLRGTSASVVLVLASGGRETRVPVRALVACPPPVVSPGSRVRITVTMGNVRASAHGEARQAGRVGDVIRVRNTATRASLRAIIRSAELVELLP